MVNKLSAVEHFVDRMESIQSIDDLGSNLAQSARDLGFTYYSYVTARVLGDDAASTSEPLTYGSYPEAWLSHYKDNNYNYIDPVLAVGKRKRGLFCWGGNRFTEAQPSRYRLMLNEARDYGICRGLTMPVHRGGGESGYLSVSLDDRLESFDEVVKHASMQIQLIAHLAHDIAVENFLRLPEKKEIRLTAREREVLFWAGEGKTAWETSVILGCSISTARFHVQNALKKLDVSNKFSAFIKAQRFGLLD